jgi:hypothetical protein
MNERILKPPHASARFSSNHPAVVRVEGSNVPGIIFIFSVLVTDQRKMEVLVCSKYKYLLIFLPQHEVPWLVCRTNYRRMNVHKPKWNMAYEICNITRKIAVKLHTGTYTIHENQILLSSPVLSINLLKPYHFCVFSFLYYLKIIKATLVK